MCCEYPSLRARNFQLMGALATPRLIHSRDPKGNDSMNVLWLGPDHGVEGIRIGTDFELALRYPNTVVRSALEIWSLKHRSSWWLCMFREI